MSSYANNMNKNVGNTKNKNQLVLLNSQNIFYEGGGRTLNEIIYPIGSVIIRVDSANPSQWYGGTWELLCPGRTLVCINTSDNDFNSVKKTGGEKTHTLSVNEMPQHSHIFQYGYGYQVGGTGGSYSFGAVNKQTGWSGLGTPIGYRGNSQAHNNLQPYMVVYIWVRVS